MDAAGLPIGSMPSHLSFSITTTHRSAGFCFRQPLTACALASSIVLKPQDERFFSWSSEELFHERAVPDLELLQ
jgi:hypothetical protein